MLRKHVTVTESTRKKQAGQAAGGWDVSEVQRREMYDIYINNNTPRTSTRDGSTCNVNHTPKMSFERKKSDLKT